MSEIKGQLYINNTSGGGGGGAAWGDITGTLSDQVDLQTALDAKVDETTTVNSQPLSSNVTLVTDDIAEDGAPTNLWFTDERAQDAVGAALTDTNTIDFVYTDAAGTIEANVIYQDSQTVNLSDNGSGLKADIIYQDTNTIDLSEDASGLKADVKFSSATDNVASNSTGVYVKRQSTVTTTAPTVSNDSTQGILVGHTWVDTTGKQTYICVDNSTGAAVWKVDSGMYREMDIPANAMTPLSSNADTLALTVDLATSPVGTSLEVLSFPTAPSSGFTPNIANFTVRFPSVIDAANLMFQLHWMGDTTASGGVTWAIGAYSAGNGDTVVGTYSGGGSIDDTTSIVANQKIVSFIFGSSTTFPAGDVVYFQVYRAHSAPNDTYAGNAQLERIVIQYKESNAVNSAIFS